jgi:alpha-N-arabinofuranosidase
LKDFSFGIYQDRHFRVEGIGPLALAQEPLEKTNAVTVLINREEGPVNKKIFGNNVLGHEGLKSADYGYGLWDSKWDRASVRAVVDLAKGAGITMVRFPGGCGTHAYDWKKAVGKDRKEFLFGIDEFLTTAEAMGAEAVLTVSYFTGDEGGGSCYSDWGCFKRSPVE